MNSAEQIAVLKQRASEVRDSIKHLGGRASTDVFRQMCDDWLLAEKELFAAELAEINAECEDKLRAAFGMAASPLERQPERRADRQGDFWEKITEDGSWGVKAYKVRTGDVYWFAHLDWEKMTLVELKGKP